MLDQIIGKRRMTFFKKTLLVLSTVLFASSVTAEDGSTVNYSTDNKLLGEVKTHMILDNGLAIHIWEWNDKAKELGMD